MTTFSEAVELSLKTWYPKGHELHMNAHHPLGKLLGEWGELLDDYMKSLYKPDYQFDPKDELGDIWYYVRILAYQFDYIPTTPSNVPEPQPLEALIAVVMNEVSMIFIAVCSFISIDDCQFIQVSYCLILEICRRYDLTLDELTQANWEKLKPGSERGEQWMKAR